LEKKINIIYSSNPVAAAQIQQKNEILKNETTYIRNVPFDPTPPSRSG
jgi:hypothetical protein